MKLVVNMNGHDIEVTVGLVSPNNKKKFHGIVKSEKGKGIYFVWDATKYSEPVLYVGKKLINTRNTTEGA
jgi:hypothetical protein